LGPEFFSGFNLSHKYLKENGRLGVFYIRALNIEIAIADHVKNTDQNIKWDHFEILASGKTDYHCKVKETSYTQDLRPALSANIRSEKLSLH